MDDYGCINVLNRCSKGETLFVVDRPWPSPKLSFDSLTYKSQPPQASRNGIESLGCNRFFRTSSITWVYSCRKQKMKFRLFSELKLSKRNTKLRTFVVQFPIARFWSSDEGQSAWLSWKWVENGWRGMNQVAILMKCYLHQFCLHKRSANTSKPLQTYI